LIKGLLRVQLGARNLAGCNMGLPNEKNTLNGAGKLFEREKLLDELGVTCLFLIKHDVWARTT
jgi:hypothetical protein